MKLSDEQIIAALLTSRTNAAAARQLGVSAKTLYVRLRRADFQEKLRAAQDELVSRALSKLTGSLSDAADVIARIVRDNGTAAQTRVNAADCLLRNYLRLSEHCDLTARIAALETKEKEREGGVYHA